MVNIWAWIYQKPEPDTRGTMHVVYSGMWSQGAGMADKMEGLPAQGVLSIWSPLWTAGAGRPRKGKKRALIQWLSDPSWLRVILWVNSPGTAIRRKNCSFSKVLFGYRCAKPMDSARARVKVDWSLGGRTQWSEVSQAGSLLNHIKPSGMTFDILDL